MILKHIIFYHTENCINYIWKIYLGLHDLPSAQAVKITELLQLLCYSPKYYTVILFWTALYCG